MMVNAKVIIEVFNSDEGESPVQRFEYEDHGLFGDEWLYKETAEDLEGLVLECAQPIVAAIVASRPNGFGVSE